MSTASDQTKSAVQAQIKTLESELKHINSQLTTGTARSQVIQMQLDALNAFLAPPPAPVIAAPVPAPAPAAAVPGPAAPTPAPAAQSAK